MSEVGKQGTPKLLVIATVPTTLCSFLLPYAQYFRSRGWQVDSAANGVTKDCCCRSAFAYVHDVRWHRNPFHPGNVLAVRSLRRLVAKEGYDIVHVHTPVAAFLTRVALRRIRRSGLVRVVYTAHGFHFFRGSGIFSKILYGGLEKVASRWMDRLIVINREDEKAAASFLRIEAGKWVHMPGIGVELTRYAMRPLDRSLREELQISPTSKVILVVGELSKRKRPLDVVQAAARLPSEEEWTLLFAGDGPLRGELEKWLRRTVLSQRARILGWRNDIAALMGLADVLVLASSQEGLPRCVMEAMAAQLPVVGTAVRGTRDLLEGGAGIVVPVGDAGALAHAMHKALEGGPEIDRMVEVAYQRIQDYSIDRLQGLHEALYSELL